MDAGEYAHMVVILDQTDYRARLKKQGEAKVWRIGNADLNAWGVAPILRPIPVGSLPRTPITPSVLNWQSSSVNAAPTREYRACIQTATDRTTQLADSVL